MMRLLLLGGLLVAGVWLWSYRRAGPTSRTRQRRAFWVLLAVGLLVLLARTTGLHWLAAAGAAGLAVLRALAPWLLRALPLLARFVGARKRGAAASQPGGSGPATRGRPGPMTRAQALDVLGLAEGASQEAITAQYRKLVRELHPDQGGSQFLTQQLNQARDVLLKG